LGLDELRELVYKKQVVEVDPVEQWI
jgi:hypothetical protein